MVGEDFWLGTDGMWHRRGHPDVPPGAGPNDPAPPTGIRKLQVGRLGLTSTPKVVVPPGSTGGWPGDPGDGNYYIGWALGPNNTTIAAADNNGGWPVGRVSMIHNYAGGDGSPSASIMDEAIARNMISSQSFKPSYTPADIKNGLADAAIDAWAARVAARAPWPIWLCYYHEPEDNITTTAAKADYRAAYRRIVARFRAAGVTNVVWQPIYMNPFTFGSSGRDWRTWHADWTGTTWQDDIMMDVMGMDTYNPLPWTRNDSAGNPLPPPEGPWWSAERNNNGFDSMFNTARAKVELPGYPLWDYTIPEFGMSNAFAGADPDWRPWCTTARDYMKANRIKAIFYWDNSGDTGRYSFDTRFTAPAGFPNPDSNGTKKLGWNIITNAASVWRTPTGAAPIG